MSKTMTSNTQQKKQDVSQEAIHPEIMQTFLPRVDIWEGEDELTLQADMPGVQPENVDLQIEERELTIRGKVCPRYTDVNVMHREFAIGNFQRTFTIGQAIDADIISAEMSNGVLTLHLPKSENAKPRRIEVKAR